MAVGDAIPWAMRGAPLGAQFSGPGYLYPKMNSFRGKFCVIVSRSTHPGPDYLNLVYEGLAEYCTSRLPTILSDQIQRLIDCLLELTVYALLYGP